MQSKTSAQIENLLADADELPLSRERIEAIAQRAKLSIAHSRVDADRRAAARPPAYALELPPEEMRKLGRQTLDIIFGHLATLPDQKVTGFGSAERLRALAEEPLPEKGTPCNAVLTQVVQDVFGPMCRTDHPRFFAFVPGPSNFVSAMADALASGLNVFAGAWTAGAGPAQVERTTIGWLAQLCGLPGTAGGLFVNGGSEANLLALRAARKVRLQDRIAGGVVYGSDQTHVCIARALDILGFAPDQLRLVPSDADGRLRLDALAEAVAADRARGLRPFCVVANVGTTNTGAVDPLCDMADFCAAEQLWLHADGAYGAAAVLCPRGKELLRGLERVDSLVVDPHKWLFQPYEIGCLLMREPKGLLESFRILHGEQRDNCMKDVREAEDEINYADYGIQLTRSFRALKLWMSLKVFGVDAFRQAIARGFELAERAEALFRESPTWEVVTSAQFGVVTFRYCGDGSASEEELDLLNERIVEDLTRDGFARINSTRIHGRLALRMRTTNPRTTESDLRATVRRMEMLAKTAEAQPLVCPRRVAV